MVARTSWRNALTLCGVRQCREEHVKKLDQQLQSSLKVQSHCKNEQKKCFDSTRLIEEEPPKREEELQTCLKEHNDWKGLPTHITQEA